MADAGRVLETPISGERNGFRESYLWGVSFLLDGRFTVRPDHSSPATGSEVA
jgi:hypothetical protein